MFCTAVTLKGQDDLFTNFINKFNYNTLFFVKKTGKRIFAKKNKGNIY